MQATIYLIDDHSIVLDGLTHVLSTQGNMKVVGATGDRAKALKDVAQLKPKVVVLELSSETVVGVGLIGKIKEAVPGVGVLVFSIHPEEMFAERCLRAGALGYLSKCEPIDRLIEGIRLIVEGSFCFKSALLERLVSGKKAVQSKAPDNEEARLTPREMEVFELTGKGLSYLEIAEKLGMSPKTATMHRSNIQKKLGLKSFRELTMRALEWVEQ